MRSATLMPFRPQGLPVDLDGFDVSTGSIEVARQPKLSNSARYRRGLREHLASNGTLDDRDALDRLRKDIEGMQASHARDIESESQFKTDFSASERAKAANGFLLKAEDEVVATKRSTYEALRRRNAGLSPELRLSSPELVMFSGDIGPHAVSSSKRKLGEAADGAAMDPRTPKRHPRHADRAFARKRRAIEEADPPPLQPSPAKRSSREVANADVAPIVRVDGVDALQSMHWTEGQEFLVVQGTQPPGRGWVGRTREAFEPVQFGDFNFR